MAKAIDITGEKYGRLTVIEMIRKYNNKKKTYCRCICECGNEVFIEISSLRSGNTKSCGCINIEILNNRNNSKNKLKDVSTSPPPKLTKKETMKQYVTQKFNHLTVIDVIFNYKQNDTYFLCKCDCGNEKHILSTHVLHDKIKSCGCNKFKDRIYKKLYYNYNDITGQKFGRLTALYPLDNRSKNGALIWRCQCDCGNTKDVASGDLKSGKTLSCGCWHQSQYEDLVDNLLFVYNLKYVKQFKFSDCKNEKILRFDYYIPQYNTCIECQGQQHYYAIDFFGGEDKLKKTQENDKIKLKYCENNNINLICLPYTLSENEYREVILNILNPVTITA